ncbi:MAG: Flp pilus assembly protein CpaB [Candidatus Methylacidiphilales bacterium]
MIAGAALLGIVAVFLIFSYISSQQAENDKKFAEMQRQLEDAKKNKPDVKPVEVVQVQKKETKMVAYATMRIAAGQKITSEQFQMKETPEDLIPGALKEAEAPNKFARKTIEIGDPITSNNASDKLPLMSMVITPGYRAMAMPIWNDPAVNSTGGWVNDGDRVDLILSYEDPPGSKQMRTKIMLQYLKVLFMPGAQRDDTTGGVFSAAGAPLTVTFEVTPEQAEMLASLEGFGKLRMVLRASFDDVIGKYSGVITNDVVENPEAMNKNAIKSIDRATEAAKIVEQNKLVAQQKAKEEAARQQKKAEEGLKKLTPQ